MPKAKKTNEVSYRQAVQEIEEILESIDRDETDIDELSVKVERAVELIRICQGKLKTTELRVTTILQELDQPEETAPETSNPDPSAEPVAEAEHLEEEDGELPF